MITIGNVTYESPEELFDAIGSIYREYYDSFYDDRFTDITPKSEIEDIREEYYEFKRNFTEFLEKLIESKNN